MFLPLGDEPNPRGVPVVTYGLIAVNVAVYLFIALPLSTLAPDLNDQALTHYIAILSEQFSGQLSESELLRQVSAYDLVVFSYGFRPAQPDLGALLTSMFLHSGLMHLIGNMLFLWIYGDNVEHRLGSLRFLWAYLLMGVVATLFHMTFDARSELPLVGASGAISGVLGFYFIWFPRNRVRLWIVLFPFFMRVVHWPARMVLGIYLFWDNVMPFLITRGMGGGGIAYGAHIGGFLGGLGWAWWADRRRVDSGFGGHQDAEDHTVSSPTEEVARLLEQGKFWDVTPAYFRLTADQSKYLLTPDHSIALADWLAKHDRAEEALVVYQRHVRDYPVGPLAAEAHLGAGLVQLNALEQPTAAYQHLVEVFDLNPGPDTANCARQALAKITAQQKFKVRETPTL